MNKKTLYWITGIIAAVLILFIAWFFLKSDSTTEHGTHNGNHGNVTENTTGSSSKDDTADTKDNDKNKKLASYMEEQNEVMDEMMDDMHDVEPTGYAALDFLIGMIPHHEAAVDMSESYLEYGGTNEELKKLAQNIIEVQEKEITEMKKMAETLEAQGKQDTEKEQAYLKEYEKMFSSHAHMNHGTQDNVEAAFAEGMIMHHQMAVDMAQAILPNTEEEQVLALAQNIIDSQNQEIQQMKDILREVG